MDENMKKWLQTETGSQIDAFPLCHKISLSVLVNTVNDTSDWNSRFE